ncbi:MAG: inositol monophosphatase [Erythrobacter sp.]|nr:inositol monophosphatase [Erythrobacter sp.]
MIADQMADVLREAAQRAVLPRYQSLAENDIEEKTPGDLVTIADREAETIIAKGLAGIRPNARFVGEEACARSPQLLKHLDEGEVWIVDPIDGTGNYASGSGPFAMMAALARHGELVAACILNPLTGEALRAERGAGAWRDGARLRPSVGAKSLSSLTGIISDFQRPTAMEQQVARVAQSAAHIAGTQRCAGAEYPLVASGEVGFALYWRTLVWDHAPGVLILEEAGGQVARLDGTRYRVTDQRAGLLLAHSPDVWDQAAAALSR